MSRLPRSVEVPQEPDDLGSYFKDVTRIDLLSLDRERSLAEKLVSSETAAWHVALEHDEVAHATPRIISPIIGTPIGAVPRGTRAGEMRKLDPDRVCIAALERELGRERDRKPSLWWKRSRTPAAAKLVAELRRHNAEAVHVRDAFVTANLRLVVSMAKRYRTNVSVSMSDLIQEGNIGLVHSVGRFEPERGLRFSTFAVWWIRHFMGRCIENTASTVRIPVHMRQTIRGIGTARGRLLAQLGRLPTVAELATETGLPVGDIERLKLFLVGKASSLDELINPEEPDSLTRVDVLVADGPATDDIVDGDRMSDRLHRHIERLKPMEAAVIRSRFGIGGAREDTFKDIGAHYNLTRERIRQVQENALKKLRRYVERDRLEVEARRFVAQVEDETSEAKVDLDVPVKPGGLFRMDVRIGARVAVITWTDDRAYRIVDHSPYATMEPAEAHNATFALLFAKRMLASQT